MAGHDVTSIARVNLSFHCALERLGLRSASVEVIIQSPGKTSREVEHQAHQAADELARLLSNGQRLRPCYSFQNGQIIPRRSGD